MLLVLLSVFLTASLCLNIYLGMSVDRLYDQIDKLLNSIGEYKNSVENTLQKLEEVDDRQLFQKDDDVGFVFSEIVKLIKQLNKRIE